MLQVLFAVEQHLYSYQEEKSTEKKRRKRTMESLSKFDWLKGLKQKAGKFSIKSSASQACDIYGGSKSRRGQDQEEVDQDCTRPRRSG